MNTKLPHLPPQEEIETLVVLKQLTKSHRYLAELKGTVKTIPNEHILINTLALQEAKDSSEIENIVTTHDDLYKENILIETKNPATKEVYNYAQSLKLGFEIVRKEQLLLNKHIIAIQQKLEQNKAGFRTQAGTKLVNSFGEVVYIPPQDKDEILSLMANLEKFINDNDFSGLDPLTKMAVIHYQFESIHPFYDGNGRTGRIVNILYLVLQGLLDLPVLYLSRYIIRNKQQYYQVLQGVRSNNDWESLILYLIKGVEVTAKQTIDLVQNIKTLMQDTKHRLREDLPKIYSQDLLNNLFKNPYTKIEFLEKDLGVSRRTAQNYLDVISDIGILEKVKIGKSNYYINNNLIDVLAGTTNGK
ncbi:Fic family protein [Riemerella columbipharyngis]|uniref:Fic family protein n=1 Tax=Riemerella columbipharyngis TaxID=1071918 RepID=A0A1G7DA35_9FLAO|nr:Fic family protein [Riemerella columbipharyngis]SDE48508.1 Fic family protein [Riemerella columbipharyngis]